MIRIRRVHSSLGQEDVLRQVQEIFRENFSAVAAYADKVPSLLDEPLSFGYRTVLLVADKGLNRVAGFALVMYFTEIKSAFLDFMAVNATTGGRGVGGALFEAVREYCVNSKARGLYLESLPDDPGLVQSAGELAENRRRLKFYERYGARPLEGTAYETAIGGGSAPHLLFDGLGREKPLGRKECQAAVRLILERKYGEIASREYIRMVVDSIRDDPVRIRAPRYIPSAHQPHAVLSKRLGRPFGFAVSLNHQLHHVHDRGYVERPARIRVLADVVGALPLFEPMKVRHFPESVLRMVHDGDFVNYLKNVCERLSPTTPVYPYVFPIRRPERRPKELAIRAGYYCIDTFTPLYQHAYEAARGAVDVALSAAGEILRGRHVAYALCRPPGHHAERRVFGGFCYFNNAALAAEYLVRKGLKPAVFDVDFHHGNGTQDIFYRRNDVLVVSTHGHPNFAYPYFSGFRDETGEGPGLGFNRNFPLPEQCSEERYLDSFSDACEVILRFKPDVLVLSLGFDIMKGDPTGEVLLTARGMETIGRRLAGMKIPVLVVQEGGYTLRNLRQGVRSFFAGLATGQV